MQRSYRIGQDPNKIAQLKSHIYIEKGDITKIDTDCIVNAANNSLLGGGGVDGAIHRAAGPGLLEECKTLNGCANGEAKITSGYLLPAEFVIHTVGPVYSGRNDDYKLLTACYLNSLDLARRYKIHSIAFPAISTGAYGYPIKESVRAAMAAVTSWLDANYDYAMIVVFVCMSERVYMAYDNYIHVAHGIEKNPKEDPNMKKCINGHKYNISKFNICPYCGAPRDVKIVAEKKMKIVRCQCGYKSDITVISACPNCGNRFW